ncbi:MAG: amidohydrolase family protein [Granulosicoccus sp.]
MLKSILGLTLLPNLIFGVGDVLAQSKASIPIADAHVHYSHDSVELTPPERVVEIMREANLKFALVSSSDDQGTQLLLALAPDLIVPGLRPYTRRGQLNTWYTSEENLSYVETLLENNRYASIGEFHLFGDTADLPIPRRIVELADLHNLILHAHSDAEAIARLLAQSPTVKIIWAHSGFDEPAKISAMLDKHDRLWADLAYRSDVGRGGQLDDAWIELFKKHPDRMMLGTDTYTPERIYFIPSHAEVSREWLATLPKDLAQNIAWKNAHELIMPVWQANRKTAAHLDCALTDHGFVIEDDGLVVSIQPLESIAVSQPFPVTVTVCGAAMAGATVTLDATMPAHGHGMNYAPTHTVYEKSEQRHQIRVEGVVLHMPGNWLWSVDVRVGDFRKTLSHEFQVR